MGDQLRAEGKEKSCFYALKTSFSYASLHITFYDPDLDLPIVALGKHGSKFENDRTETLKLVPPDCVQESRILTVSE